MPNDASTPRRRSLLAWEPTPFAVAAAAVVAVSAVPPTLAPWWLFWPVFAVAALALVWLVVAVVMLGRRANPDRWGDLSSLEGLRLVPAEPPARTVRTTAPVDDAHRHQAAIELAVIHGGHAQRAVLVPGARRWLGRRYRTGVQLTGGGMPRHAGFLQPAADARWRGLLGALAHEGAYAEVPATVTGQARPYRVELDLGGLSMLEAARGDAVRG
ncbi:hypothetical protein [Agromyces archimandritae]|uniref:Uncharacterized protein n=1 Tax=Agromyces archimandritae TaxID=2781962 RepID=A0A975FN99_9MICO|nr:hypothetical protein [Agromyces archimandritae]QTX05066.1 hypothetical protein G127AT_02150 [Agromyces archimandritae]